MFTGITEEKGIIRQVTRGTAFFRLKIGCRRVLEDAYTGDSIAVNGICLTVTEKTSDGFSADVMPETMRRTALHQLRVSDPVNLERALRLSDRLGGHLVSGHIDGVGTIAARTEESNAIWLTLQADGSILKYIIEKGSVTLDGVSLTVARASSQSFAVSLIPHTAKTTTLGIRKAGDLVNIETDMIGKYVEKLMSFEHSEQTSKSRVTEDFLKENGFL